MSVTKKYASLTTKQASISPANMGANVGNHSVDRSNSGDRVVNRSGDNFISQSRNRSASHSGDNFISQSRNRSASHSGESNIGSAISSMSNIKSEIKKRLNVQSKAIAPEPESLLIIINRHARSFYETYVQPNKILFLILLFFLFFLIYLFIKNYLRKKKNQKLLKEYNKNHIVSNAPATSIVQPASIISNHQPTYNDPLNPSIMNPSRRPFDYNPLDSSYRLPDRLPDKVNIMQQQQPQPQSQQPSPFPLSTYNPYQPSSYSSFSQSVSSDMTPDLNINPQIANTTFEQFVAQNNQGNNFGDIDPPYTSN